MLKKFRLMFKIAVIDVKLLYIVFRDFLFNWDYGFSAGTCEKNNIIIIGGELFNKGSQAMVFTAVDQLKKIYPSKTIYLFSQDDFKRTENDKNKYNFTILPWDREIKLSLLGASIGLLYKGSNAMRSELERIIKDTFIFLDISGYALSSQWGYIHSINYLLNIMVAKRFNVSYFIFPQSIGPFTYRMKDKMMISLLLRLYAGYPRLIFVRENEGIRWLRKYTQKNVLKCPDIVLCSRNYDQKLIFRVSGEIKRFDIHCDTVALIPNERVFERIDKNYMYSLYRAMIGKLLSMQKHVVILKHSYEDQKICREIYRDFIGNGSTHLVIDELNSIELAELIGKCRFIIASRYHSVINAYKHGVPAIVIGWATKYSELLEDFEQSNYFFNVLSSLDETALHSAIMRMDLNRNLESSKILNKIQTLQKVSPFGFIEGIYAKIST